MWKVKFNGRPIETLEMLLREEAAAGRELVFLGRGPTIFKSNDMNVSWEFSSRKEAAKALADIRAKVRAA